MLFRKKITKSCLYCAHATILDPTQALCVKKGVVSTEKPCRKFRYDPCKRVPLKPKAPSFQYEEDQFQL